MKAQLKIAIFLLFPAISLAQVPVDDDGNVIGQYETGSDADLLSATELEELVGPIALYPDDLLAIVLPASAYPLQIVEAARFLEAYERDSSLEPDTNWDDAVVALTNYPEVIELLNDDLDWTLRLGDAVVAQQADVVSAVESFRDRAYAAGNLKSDEYQTVSEDDGVIYIAPAREDVIYVPYYEPARVVYYQPRPVYYYHPRAYPVYYYPYAAGHHFSHNYFWGVTTAFTIGWSSHSLHTWHHSYHGHPYYGRSYWNHWYRRPSIQVYNSYYTHNYNRSRNYNSHGDQWRPRERRREYVRREGYVRNDRNGDRRTINRTRETQPIAFRERDDRVAPRRPVANVRDNGRQDTVQRNTTRRDTARQDTVQRNTTRRDTAQQDTVQRNTTRRDAAQPDTVQRNTTRRDAAQPDTVQRNTTRRNNTRQDTTVRPSQDERPEITFRQRDSRRQEPGVRPGVAQRQNTPTVRAPQTERRQSVAQSRNAQRQATVVRPQETRSAPAPSQSRRSVQQPRQPERSVRQREQTPQPAQQQSNNRDSSKKSESRSNETRSRSKSRSRR